MILFGSILSIVGVAMPVATIAFPFLFVASGGPFLFLAAQYANAALSALFYGVGGFLVLYGFARIRPDSRPWTSVAAVVVLGAGAARAGIAGAQAIIVLNADSFRVLPDLLLWTSIPNVAANVALGTAVFAGLYGLGRALIRAPEPIIA